MALVLDSISKSFSLADGSTVDALSGISLAVADSEFVSVLGPSGCGKTTLLRIVAGLETPTSGTITLDGERIAGPSPRMAMIFQEYSLYPWRTVIDNIEFGLEIRGMTREERKKRAIEYLDLVGLRDFAGRFPYELSGGMRQRVAVARALAIDPAILLMDEPFGALDAQTRNRLQRELLDIWEKTRKTVLFVTHSVDEAVYLSDRIVVLTPRPGRIREIVPIGLPRPRERTDVEFARIRRYVLDHVENMAATR
ncbi:MAG TPA: ABC transporter ATP-binding protein [Methanolinea sp.]|nr:ABC transporter ATP-binding protein [Methanolinea sp.]